MKVTRDSLYGGAVLIVVFLIDVFIPLGVADGALYVCTIVLVMRERKRVITAFAVLTSFMALLKFYIFYTPDTSWMVYVNRSISLIVIWATASLAIRYRLLEEKEKKEALLIEQKNKELEQFIYITSHDLKEPLRTIEGIVGLLEKEYDQNLDENGKRYVGYINSSVMRMNSLTKALLDYGRIGQDSVFVDIDCNRLLREIQEDIALSINDTKAKILVEDLPRIMGMENELRMLFQNLISNSIKFQKPGVPPEISISVVKQDEMWKFAIQDNGIGIDEKFKEKIFVIFQRLHKRNEYEGTGIGLAHCKKIVQLHGGDIWIESTPGNGTIFYFTLSQG